MILGFSTQIKGKPTYFVEKIQRALTDTDFYSTPELVPYEFNFNLFKTCKPKLHTIREDKTNRWKAGINIDFFINVRKKDMFRFAPVLPVVSVQKVEITWLTSKNENPYWYKDASVSIDKRFISTKECEELSKNDGFDTVEEFFEYFNEDFKGKIIHWTDKRY